MRIGGGRTVVVRWKMEEKQRANTSRCRVEVEGETAGGRIMVTRREVTMAMTGGKGMRIARGTDTTVVTTRREVTVTIVMMREKEVTMVMAREKEITMVMAKEREITMATVSSKEMSTVRTGRQKIIMMIEMVERI